MNQIIAFFKAIATDLVDGASGLLRMTKQRGLHVNLRSNDGSEAGTVANPILVSGGGGAFGGPVTQATVPWVVSGTVSVSNFPATQPVSGTVAATQGTSPWVVSLVSTTITGTVGVTQSTSPWVVSGSVTVSGTVAVSNFPVTQAVTQSTSPWVVSLTSTTITGTVAVTGTFWQATQPVSIAGTVTVSLASTTITGTVAVTQSTSPWVISGSVTVASGSITITNTSFAAIQGTSPWVVSLISTTITGTVAVTQSTSPWVVSLTSTTITGTVDVSGSSVSVSNFPATQPVSGTVTANAKGLFDVNPTLPLNDGDTAQLSLDDLGRLRVLVDDSPRTRRLLEAILIELQMLNSRVTETMIR